MSHQSTEHVFHKVLPQLITLDALRIPTKLVFDVEGPLFPKLYLEDALHYVQQQDTHVLKDGDMFFFLKLTNSLGLRKIEKRHIDMFKEARQGKKDKRIKDVDHLIELCGSFHVLQPACNKYGHVRCEANPMELVCSCGRGKLYGICPHIIAANHISRRYNAREQLMCIGRRTLKAPNQHPTKALRKAPQRTPLNAQEEEYQLHLGNHGR